MTMVDLEWLDAADGSVPGAAALVSLGASGALLITTGSSEITCACAAPETKTAVEARRMDEKRMRIFPGLYCEVFR